MFLFSKQELFPGSDEIRAMKWRAQPAAVAMDAPRQQRGVNIPTAWGDVHGQEMSTDDTLFEYPPDRDAGPMESESRGAFIDGGFQDVTLLRDDADGFGGEGDEMERSYVTMRLPPAPQTSTDEGGEYMHLEVDSGSRRGFADEDLVVLHRDTYPTLEAEEEVARITDRLTSTGVKRRPSDAEQIYANQRASRISVGDFRFSRNFDDVFDDLSVLQAADRGETALLSHLLSKGTSQEK